MEELLKFVAQEVIYNSFNKPQLGGPIAYLGWIFLILPYGIISLYEKSTVKVRREKIKWNYPRALYFAGFFTIFVHYYCLTKNLIYPFPLITETISINLGILLMIFGLYLVTHGRISLDGYWGPNIYKYSDDRRLIKNGIYKIMRHPIYSGQITMSIATTFLLSNMVIIIFPVILIPINILRARREDKYLLEEFPDEFPKYKEQTPAFGGFFG